MNPTHDEFSSPERISGGPYAVGEVIAGRYRLVRVLGEGGMGWLWVARDEELEIDVALKLLRTDLVLEAGAERFLNEARAAAAIEHPAVVSVSNVGETPTGTPFIVMELLEGSDLAQMIGEKGRIPVETAIGLLLPAIEALAVAHDHGVVHRDLKPENIFLVPVRGGTQPKIIDFGIARNTHKVDGALTQAGVAMGSPDYMSPEQARGERDIDARTDVWAICTVLYEAVCGEVPFADRPYNALLRAIIEEPVPSLAARGVDDLELQQILDRGFRKARAERWPGMRDFGRALAGLLLARGVEEDAAGNSLRVAWIQPRSSMISLENISAQVFRSAPPVSGRTEHVTSVAPPPRSRSQTALLVALASVAVGVTAGFLLLGSHGAPRPAGAARASPAFVPPDRARPAARPVALPPAPVTVASHAPPPPSASVGDKPEAPPGLRPAPRERPAPAAPRAAKSAAPRPSASAAAPSPRPAPAPGDDLGF